MMAVYYDRRRALRARRRRYPDWRLVGVGARGGRIWVLLPRPTLALAG